MPKERPLPKASNPFAFKGFVDCKKFQETPMAFPRTPESRFGQAVQGFIHEGLR